MFRAFPAAMVACFLASSLSIAQEASEVDGPEDPNERRRAEVQKSVESYLKAFESRDVERLLAHWADDGVYVNKSTGERVEGHPALREQFESLAEAEGSLKLQLVTESIEFVSPNVALELGVAIVLRDDNDPVRSTYSAVHVQQGEKWLIDRVTETEEEPANTHYESLKELAWLIGEWVDQGDGYRVELSADWTTNQNYISRKYRVYEDDQIVSSGLQLIGWDARQKVVRSWLFDSDGGFVLGQWHNEDNQWAVTSVATLADGGAGSFTSVYEPQDDGNYYWSKVNRVMDGKILPNLDPTLVTRK